MKMATTINLNGGEPIYLLLGEDACREYEENGIDGVVERYEDNDLYFNSYIIKDGGSLFDLLEAMDGWNNYTVITKEEYEKL